MSEVTRRKCDVCGKESAPFDEYSSHELDGWIGVHCSAVLLTPPGTGKETTVTVVVDTCSRSCAHLAMQRATEAVRTDSNLLLETDDRRRRREARK